MDNDVVERRSNHYPSNVKVGSSKDSVNRIVLNFLVEENKVGVGIGGERGDDY